MKKFLKYSLTFISISLLICTIAIGYIFLSYRQWEEEFESKYVKENILQKESIKEIDLNEKVARFTLSELDTESLSISSKEFGSILFNILDPYLPKDISLEKIYIESNKNLWNIFLNLNIYNTNIWISFDLNKDDIQSPQVYCTYIKVGPFNIGNQYDLVQNVNKGIGEAIVTLNENGFVGRYIENIELQQQGLVLKGSRY